jgi:hypothetical protein
MAFRSKLEEKVADLLVELGVKYEYETTKVPYVIEHIYTPDFILPNGVERSKTTYAKWCERHDIPWTSFQNIPLKWLL